MNKKHIFIFTTIIILVFTCQLQAQSKSTVDDSLQKFDQLMSNFTVDSIIGKPIRSGKTIVIPFARIKFGLGAGGAANGYGGGMGGKVIPMGVLIIDGEDINIELFPLEEKKPSLLQEMLPVLLKMLPQFLGNKTSVPAQPSSTAAQVPKNSAAVSGELSLDQAKKLFNENKFLEALEVIDSLLYKDPHNADLHAWKGIVKGSLSQDDNPLNMMKYGMGAMQEFEEAIRLGPDNATAHFGRAMGRLNAPEGFGRDLDGAIEDLEFTCKNDPFPDAYYYLGQAVLQKGQKDKAAIAFKKALSLDPDHTEAAEALAKIK